eukprot:6705237-Lingulodinium_polyedra.AAC.1
MVGEQVFGAAFPGQAGPGRAARGAGSQTGQSGRIRVGQGSAGSRVKGGQQWRHPEGPGELGASGGSR